MAFGTAFCDGISGDPPGSPSPSARDEEVYTVTIERGRGIATVVFRAILRNLNAAQLAAPPSGLSARCGRPGSAEGRMRMEGRLAARLGFATG